MLNMEQFPDEIVHQQIGLFLLQCFESFRFSFLFLVLFDFGIDTLFPMEIKRRLFDSTFLLLLKLIELLLQFKGSTDLFDELGEIFG